MNGLRGLLADGGWFVGTEFGREEGGKDVVQEARKKVAAEKLKEEAAVGSSEETPETKVSCLLSLSLSLFSLLRSSKSYR